MTASGQSLAEREFDRWTEAEKGAFLDAVLMLETPDWFQPGALAVLAWARATDRVKWEHVRQTAKARGIFLRDLEAALAEYSRAKHGNDTTSPKPTIVTMSDVQPETVEWLSQPYIPLRKLTLLEGDPGLAKTWLALVISANVSNGHSLPGDQPQYDPADVLYLSAEDGLADTLRPRLDSAGADVRLIHVLTGWQHNEERGGITLTDVTILEQAIATKRPRLVVIDPIQAYLGAKTDMHRANEVRPILSALGDLAERYDCAVLCIRHLRKTGADRAIYRGLGSIDFSAAARSILLVAKDPDDETETKRVMAHVKSSLAPCGPSLGFEIRDGEFRWTGISRLNPETLLATPRDDDEKSSQQEAEEIIKASLSKGEKTAAELFKEAKGEGISERTLRRARTKLQKQGLIDKKRITEGNEGKGYWSWHKVTNPPKETNGHITREHESIKNQYVSQDGQANSLDFLQDSHKNNRLDLTDKMANSLFIEDGHQAESENREVEEL